MIAIEAVAIDGEMSALCLSIGIARASLYRRRQPALPTVSASDPRPSPRALVPTERQVILDALHSERFVDQSPAEVHATLLEEQTYLGSVRTMYRVLADANEVRERRDHIRRTPNPSSWRRSRIRSGLGDITKLKGPAKYVYFSLYVILDLFSR
jgi:putative transposase